MTNPTTPFSWQMPTASDLVTDLPADFETFGQAVATSMADLLGGTTGQILAKNSNTDMDFTWIANDQGDITEITASSPLTGGGTSGAITVGIQDGTTAQKGAVQLENSTSSTSTTTAAVPASVKSAYDLANGAIPKTLIDAAGDLIVGTAADTAGRLGIGTAGQVLKVNSGATALEWGTAGGATSFPAFSVWKSGTQSIGTSTTTKITFTNETFDTANCFASSTFTPNVAGYYQINVQLYFSNATANALNQIFIYKNGSSIIRTNMWFQPSAGQYWCVGGTALIYMNGSSDYLEIYGNSDAGAGTVEGNQAISIFSGVGVKS